MTKLKRQICNASPEAKQLSAELLWALLLFPSNMKPATKRYQIVEIWSLSGDTLSPANEALSDAILTGIGSGGPGYSNYRPDELEYLIGLCIALKRKASGERAAIFRSYADFNAWIRSVPMTGNRQYRHMLRYFAFPERVERICSNNDRIKILEAFGKPASDKWTDSQLDEALLDLRADLSKVYPNRVLDFYETPLRERWGGELKVKTPEGEIAVTVPKDSEDEGEAAENASAEPPVQTSERESIRVQAALARIGATMGYKVWIAKADRARVRALLTAAHGESLLESLPLNYEKTTLETIELIDALWIKGRAIVRAFEVEHTTAVYSGLLRMADLLALQPDMDIRLHIVAPQERREKVFREMRRPVFSLLERGSLSKTCTFMSYEAVAALDQLEHLAFMKDTVLTRYEDQGLENSTTVTVPAAAMLDPTSMRTPRFQPVHIKGEPASENLIRDRGER